jgi:hypothetical protein
MLRSLFTAHPTSVDETYAEHMGVAFGFFLRMFLGSLACLVHAFLPFLFLKTGSDTIAELHERMVAQRRRHPAGRLARAAAEP